MATAVGEGQRYAMLPKVQLNNKGTSEGEARAPRQRCITGNYWTLSPFPLFGFCFFPVGVPTPLRMRGIPSLSRRLADRISAPSAIKAPRRKIFPENDASGGWHVGVLVFYASPLSAGRARDWQTRPHGYDMYLWPPHAKDTTIAYGYSTLDYVDYRM